MNTVKFFLFGKFSIESASSSTQRIEAKKAEELLVFLLLHRDQPHTRERLADLLWGEIPSEQAKSYLRKALWQLQSILEQVGGKEFLIVDADWIQINPHFECWLDIAVFENTFKSIRGIRGRELGEKEAGSIQSAAELYRGGLLEGWYQDWCLYQREQLQYLYTAMLGKLMNYCEANGKYENGLIFGQQILQQDKAHERTHRGLMRLYYLAGDRISAMRQYQKCMEVLKEELDIAPSESTALLYEKIRKDQFYDFSAVPKNGPKEMEQEPLNAVLSHLDAFHRELSQIQVRIAQDMRIIQKTIRGQ